MDLEQENIALRARVRELEDLARKQKEGMANFLTITKEYASIFLSNFMKAMDNAPEEDAKDLMKRHGFGNL
jgi:Rod binding domain-containing protein